jgi:guanylate kinase
VKKSFLDNPFRVEATKPMTGKAIIVSAPSGAGKTTIVRHLLETFPKLAFSVSACSRPKRENEKHGVDYYFISPDEFREKICLDEFVEWQEVYPGNYYGTLKSELVRILADEKIPIFDVDVVGGLNLKRFFGENALAIFVQPPSLEVLEVRLVNRKSESEASLKKRIAKAEKELDSAKKFDQIIINDDLENACSEAVNIVENFLLY